MSEDKGTTKKPWTGAVKADGGAKKKPAKKAAPPPRPVTYVVAPGRALTTTGRIIDAGEAITAGDVADLESLIKGGFVVKA
jgi:hypothetical protein